jgi:hypothetical protein
MASDDPRNTYVGAKGPAEQVRRKGAWLPIPLLPCLFMWCLDRCRYHALYNDWQDEIANIHAYIHLHGAFMDEAYLANSLGCGKVVVLPQVAQYEHLSELATAFWYDATAAQQHAIAGLSSSLRGVYDSLIPKLPQCSSTTVQKGESHNGVVDRLGALASKLR